MRTTVTLEDIYRPVDDAMVGVRAEIAQLWHDALMLVGLEAQDMPRAGGKMLRPALCLLSAGALGAEDLGPYVRLATAFEALHVASLAHDDVLDRALLRRGKPSLTGFWDNHAAVLGGDYLVARAVELLAEYESCAVIANAIRSVRRMAEGELYFFNRPAGQYSQEDCIRLAEQKTASLFAEAASAPAHLLDATQKTRLHDFGMALGVAFQLVDDMLDITQATEGLGKPACGDVAEGKRTIPIMFLRDALDTAGRQRLDACLNCELSDEEREWIIRAAAEAGVADRTMTICREYAEQAVSCLAALPPTPYRESMENMVEFVLLRAY